MAAVDVLLHTGDKTYTEAAVDVLLHTGDEPYTVAAIDVLLHTRDMTYCGSYYWCFITYWW